jgi:hypothetical protein
MTGLEVGLVGYLGDRVGLLGVREENLGEGLVRVLGRVWVWILRDCIIEELPSSLEGRLERLHACLEGGLRE